MNARISHLSAHCLWTLLAIAGLALACASAAAASLDAAAIGKAAGTKATAQKDGVVKIGGSRSDVPIPPHLLDSAVAARPTLCEPTSDKASTLKCKVEPAP